MPVDVCVALSESIKPKTLNQLKLNAAFDDMLDCFDKYSKIYAETYETIDVTLIMSFRSKILPELKAKARDDYYLRRLIKWKNLAENGVEFAEYAWMLLLKDLSEEAVPALGNQAQAEAKKKRILRTGFGCSIIGRLFFSIEHSCRVACSLADPEFARKTASGEVIDHREVFRSLGKLGRSLSRSGFSELAKLYAYTIKMRMLADYDEYYYDNEVVLTSAISKLLPMAKFIYARQKGLMLECGQI